MVVLKTPEYENTAKEIEGAVKEVKKHWMNPGEAAKLACFSSHGHFGELTSLSMSKLLLLFKLCSNIDEHSSFFDIGLGRGKPLHFASVLFNKIGGIEICGPLSDFTTNMLKEQLGKDTKKTIDITNGNINAFSEKISQQTHLYAFTKG